MHTARWISLPGGGTPTAGILIRTRDAHFRISRPTTLLSITSTDTIETIWTSSRGLSPETDISNYPK